MDLKRGAAWLEARSGVWPETNFGLWSGIRGDLALDALGAFNAIAGQVLAGKLEVSLSAARARIIDRHRFAMAGSLSQSNIARNHRNEEPVVKMFAKSLANLLCQVGAVIVHGEQDALDLHVMIERS